jgi:hypothetical protein
MKLFEFLEIISKEEFPFRLEYQGWSGNVKVIVNTFGELAEYCFDENGVTELTEFQEKKSTEDMAEIDSRIRDLIDRPERAWIEASKDLGIRFIHPYKFTGLNGEEYEVAGLLPDFGGGKGALITNRKSDEEAVIMADLTNDYFTSGLNPRYYDKYDREHFIETLSDWGWKGEKEKRPDWMKDE